MAVYKGRTADIKIKPSTTEHILQHCHDEFTYSVTSPRGRLLLINNQEFDTPVHQEQKRLKHRPGSEIDCDRLEELFKQLDFIVKVQENVSSKFMTELLEKETRLEEQEQYGMFALIILSHGDKSCIYGKDGRPVYYKDIRKQMSARSFRAMAGKPKLLLFQACSGSSTEKSQLNEDSCEVDDEAAAVSGSFKARHQPAPISVNSDLLIIRSSFPGYVSLLDSKKGSFLMKAFIEVMQQYSGQDELEILSKKVRSTVYKLCEEDKAMFDKYGHQTIHSSSTLTKSLYFFPGYDPTKPLQDELERVSTVLDEPINIPIRLSETPSNTTTPTTLSNPAIPVLPIPTRLQYRESQTTPSYTWCVHFTKEGKLLNSGFNYGTSGLTFTPKIPTDDKRYNSSICEHNHHLYLLQHHHEHKQYYIHKINLSDQSVSESIIKFIGTNSDRWYPQQLVVNDEFIFISDYTAKCVRVYSSKNSAHLFNIKHECISKRPWGVGLLGDSLVVGDRIKNQVSNMTISETPEVRWTCTGITGPTGLRVVDNLQMILVGSDYTKQIYVLSYQGQKLSTLTVPECTTWIGDIAVYGKQIVVADCTKQIKVYEMTE